MQLAYYVYLALFLLVFAATAYALIDAVRRTSGAFVAAGKRTKQFWLIVLGVGLAVAYVAIPSPIGLGALRFLALGSAVASIVYIVDVKPALGPMRRRGGGSQRRPGGW
jgi:hypothetical protein